jgi:serine/threonine-protein kinase
VDAPGADTGTPLETLLREVPENLGDRATPGPEQAADNCGSWSRQTIPALLGRLTARLQTRTALSAFATLLLVAILLPALYERFAEHPGGFSPSPGSPLVQSEELTAPDSAPNPANVEAVPQLPRVSTLPAMPPDLRLRQPQNPLGASETASAPGAQQRINPAVRRIASFLNSYDGGDCFLIVPLKIAEGDTRIEAYGGSPAPLTALDGEFARENGFRAVISWHQVTEAQCGAVNFVRRLRNQSGTARRPDTRPETLAGGPVLSGTVAGFGGDNLELLLVGADGRVEKLRSLLTPSGQARRNSQGGAQPQLLVAVVSGLPIEALKPAALDKADKLFDVILAETQQANNMVNAAVKYFEP